MNNLFIKLTRPLPNINVTQNRSFLQCVKCVPPTTSTVTLKKGHILQELKEASPLSMRTFSCSALFAHKRQDRSRYLSVRQTDETISNQIKDERPDFTNLKEFSFPTTETHTTVMYGIPFLDIPIVHVVATSNNSKLSLTSGDGKETFAMQSAGTCGFTNARKGTNVAAQAAAIALAKDALRNDIKTVRVCLRGIGPGRLPALKALQMTGLNVVSITDTTRLPHNGNRPKKVRRL